MPASRETSNQVSGHRRNQKINWDEPAAIPFPTEITAYVNTFFELLADSNVRSQSAGVCAPGLRCGWSRTHQPSHLNERPARMRARRISHHHLQIRQLPAVGQLDGICY